QAEIAKENEQRPASEQMRFRIGVHLGDVIVDGTNLFGDGVNIAARLEAMAEPGGICLSGAVRDQVGTRLPVAFVPLGEQRVKNITEPVRAYTIATSSNGWAPAAGPAQPSLRRQVLVPVLVALLFGALASGAWWIWSARQPGPNVQLETATPAARLTVPPYSAPRLSIVVLPFTNRSNDSEQEYFADAIT